MTHPLTPREKVQVPCSKCREADIMLCDCSLPNRTALASGSGDHAELARGKACGDRMIATADALMPWLKNYPPSTRRERAIEAANAAAAASCGPLLAEIEALRAERDAKDLEIGRVIFRATKAERKLAEAVAVIHDVDRAARQAASMNDAGYTVTAARTVTHIYGITDAFLFSKEAERG
jgi:hypothetical protein